MSCTGCGKNNDVAVKGDAAPTAVVMRKTQTSREAAKNRVLMLAVFDLMNTVFGPDSTEVRDFQYYFRSELGPTTTPEAP